MSRVIAKIHIRARCASSQRGVLIAGNLRVPCALGRSGLAYRKREGDGATPRGSWPMRRVLLRKDAARFLATGLPRSFLSPRDGWCDAPQDRNYNRPVPLPYAASHEALWRQDRLYDCIVVLGHNERPRVRNLGSAVFFHIARGDLSHTQGCIAVPLKDMAKILAVCGPRTRMVVC